MSYTSIDNPFVTPPRPWINGDEFDDTTKSGLTYYWNDPVWKTKAGDITVPSLNGGPLAGFRNYIINGDFRIWQRGESIDSVNTGNPKFNADRWRYIVAGEGSTIAKSDNAPAGFAYSCFISNGQGSNCQQRIELPEPGNPGPFAIGTEWTYSFWSTVDPATTGNPNPFLQFRDRNIGNNTNAATFTPYRTLETSVAFTRYAFTATINAAPHPTNDSLVVLVPCTGPGDTYFTGVQLEPGPVATPFEHRPIGTELALCQRYYQQGQHFMRAQPNTQLSGTVQAVPSFRVAPSINTSVTAGTSLTAFRATESSFLWEAVPDGFGQVDFTYTATAEL